MSGDGLPHWLDRVSESLREHEDRRSSILSAPPRYEILGEISRGGMGIVYRAWDPQLGRNVALKVLRPEDGRAAEAHERFEREAKLAAGLHHPHIVQIFDTGTWEGQDYIAMQLIEGTTLDQAKPDRRQALTCIRDAARALHYAHQQGIVHRDVKPGNLLVDAAGRVYVTDFGVARHAVVSATITSPGTVVGTPAYMSPEQALGMPTDARSDVYSLGATLYELVTGKPAARGRDAMEVLEAVRTKDPELPTVAAPDLSKNVESILLGAMERHPGDRYATAAELAEDIDRYLAGERPLRRPRGVSYRVRREFVRHPWRSTATIVLCALLLGAGVFLGYFVRAYQSLQHGLRSTSAEERKRDFTVASSFFPQARVELEAIEHDERSRLLAEANARAELQRTRDQEELRKAAEQKQKEIERNIADLNKTSDLQKHQLLVGELSQKFLDALSDGALPAARKSLEELKEIDPDKHRELLPKLKAREFSAGIAELERLALSDTPGSFDPLFSELEGKKYQDQKDRRPLLANAAWLRALTLERLDHPREAVSWFDRADSLGRADAALNEHRGLCLLRLEDWKRAAKDRDDLLLRRRDPLPPPPFAELYYRQGVEYMADKNWKAAIGEFTIAIKLDPQHARAYHDSGIVRFRSLGLAREALTQDLDKALEITPSLKPGPAYREIALAFARDQAEIHWKDEKAEDRSAAWTLTVLWLSRILDRTAPDDPELLLERGGMLRRLGDLEAARRDVQRSAELRPVAESLKALGILTYLQAHSQNKNRELMQASLDALSAAETRFPGTARLPYWKGICRRYLSEKEWAASLEDFRAAETAGLQSPYLWAVMARVLLELGKPEEAADYARRSRDQIDLLSEEDLLAGYPLQKRSRTEAIGLLSHEARLFQAQAHLAGKKYAICIDECGQLLRLDPGNATALLCRGIARCSDNRPKEAQEDLKEALRLTTHPSERKKAAQWLDTCQSMLNR